MIQLVPKKDPDYMYSGDVDRIVLACKNAGYGISEPVALEVWERYSDSMCAGWLHLPDDDDTLVSIILDYSESSVIQD